MVIIAVRVCHLSASVTEIDRTLRSQFTRASWAALAKHDSVIAGTDAVAASMQKHRVISRYARCGHRGTTYCLSFRSIMILVANHISWRSDGMWLLWHIVIYIYFEVAIRSHCKLPVHLNLSIPFSATKVYDELVAVLVCISHSRDRTCTTAKQPIDTTPMNALLKEPSIAVVFTLVMSDTFAHCARLVNVIATQTRSGFAGAASESTVRQTCVGAISGVSFIACVRTLLAN